MSNKLFSQTQTTPVAQAIGKVRQNEHFRLKTINGYGALANNQADFDSFFNLAHRDKMHHPCTGPVEVKGINSKHSVGIKIHRIDLDNTLSSLSISTGLKRNSYKQRYARFYPVQDNKVKLKQHVFMPAQKSVGYVATVNENPLKGSRVCPRGGNMDIPALQEGAIVYLPVDYKKALVCFGDVHFRQGCGEISGIAMESDAVLEVSAFACEKYPFPIIQTDNHFYILGYGETHDKAALNATENAVFFLKKQPALKSFEDGELYRLLGGCGHLTIGNSSGKTLSYAICLDKNCLVDEYGLSVLNPPKTIYPRKNYRQIFDKNLKRYDSLPVVHSGDSREIRLIPETQYALVRFNPVVYSFLAQGVVNAPETEKERIVINQYFADYLRKNGVEMNTLYSRDCYSLIRYEQAPQTIEVVVKSAFKGSCKHTYSNLPQTPTRYGAPIQIGESHEPYVRFDWRLESANDDAVLPEGLAEHYINVSAAKQTVLKAYRLVKKRLNKCDLDIQDICFFLNTDGNTIVCEITPDNMGPISYLGKDPKLKKLFETKDKQIVLEKYKTVRKLLKI